MIRVGVIGLGMMGLTHLDAYKRRSDVKVTAISDRDPDRLSGKVRATGNVEGQAQDGVEALDVERFEEGADLIASDQVDLVDICLPTHLHVDYALSAMATGKHVMVEKPLARTYADAQRLADAAKDAKGMTFVGMCMRFWPGWTWLKEAIDSSRYGRVLAAHFRRVASHPGGGFYANGELCGGALLDLHIHDTDFVQFCFGLPQSVSSLGYSKITGEIDHVVTRYQFAGDAAPPIVVAEGSWCLADGFPFTMRYNVNFEKATAAFDLAEEKPLTLYQNGKAEKVELDTTMGYDLEIDYFLDCIARGERPTTVTLQDAANTVKICEAERASALAGGAVTPIA